MKVNTRLMADKAHADALEARAEQLLAEFVSQLTGLSDCIK